MKKSNSTMTCGLILLLSVSSISICSRAEQTNRLPENAPAYSETASNTTSSNTTSSNTSIINTSPKWLNNNRFNPQSDLGLKFASRLLDSQNKLHRLKRIKTNSSETRKPGITVSVSTLMKPTNLPGRYLGNSKVMLVHY